MVELDHIILKVNELDKSGVFYISVFDILKFGAATGRSLSFVPA